MRVLMLTQAYDPDDPLLGFVDSWVRALACRVSRLDIVCLRSTSTNPPPQVAVWPVGSRGDGSQWRRLLDFQRRTLHLARTADIVFVHMIPRFVLAAGPAAIVHRRPIVLWYVHRAQSLELRAATALSRFVATAVPETFPFPTSKLRVLGHGVDSVWTALEAVVPPTPLVVFVGRLMPVKHQATLVRALALLSATRPDVQAVLVGGVPRGESEGYRQSLVELAGGLGISDRVTLAGPMTHAGIRDLLARASVAVNLSPPGLFDKAALESMMAGLPTIVASRSFDLLIGPDTWLRIDSPADHVALARALDRALSLTMAERNELTAAIRARTIDAHGLDAFMDRLVSLFREAIGVRA
jgi:glycosyltransferase involved in cell wall biosynthesis